MIMDKDNFFMLKDASVQYSVSGTMQVTGKRLHKTPINGKFSHERKAGDIKTLSKDSACLLRKKFQFGRLRDSDFSLLSLTLTIPPSPRGYTPPSPSDIRKRWNWFQITLVRKFPRVGWIWRIELQRRGFPHWHVLGYVPRCGESGVVDALKDIWWRFLVGLEAGLSSSRGCRDHAVWSRWEQDIVQSSVYLSAHSSKHKQEQLGWIGRQWGVINARVLDFTPVSVRDIDSRSSVLKGERFSIGGLGGAAGGGAAELLRTRY